jgi:transposase
MGVPRHSDIGNMDQRCRRLLVNANSTAAQARCVPLRCCPISLAACRVDDRRVLNGIYWRLRTGSAWVDIPERSRPGHNVRQPLPPGGRTGVWDRIFAAVSVAYDGDRQMIDASSIRAH